MNRLLQLLSILIAALFGAAGILWLIMPSFVAAKSGITTLPVGTGLSSLIGAMSASKLMTSSCILVALISKQRAWYYPGIMVFSFLAFGRFVAWLGHDAPLAIKNIAPEVIFAVVLFLASRRLTHSG